MLLQLSRIILVVLAAVLTVTLMIEILWNRLISPNSKCEETQNDRWKSSQHHSDHVRQTESRSSVYRICGSEDQTMKLSQLAPLYICVAMPAEGGDWSYLIWTTKGRSWWAQ